MPLLLVPWDTSRETQGTDHKPFPPRSQRCCAPRENSRRARPGHTKCSKASYGPLRANMATNPCAARTFTIVLWFGLVGYGLRIVVHTGEVQGSIPCASTISLLFYGAFLSSPGEPHHQEALGKKSRALKRDEIRFESPSRLRALIAPVTADQSQITTLAICKWQER